MIELISSHAARLLGSEPTQAASRLQLLAAAEAAASSISRLDTEVDRLAQPKPWLRLEELAGLATAARAAGEDVELAGLVRDRLCVRTVEDLALAESTRDLAAAWCSDSPTDATGRRAVVIAALMQPEAVSGEQPGSLLPLALRLEQIARSASWSLLPSRELKVDHARELLLVSSSDAGSSVGDYVMAQPSALQRIGLTNWRLPSVAASPALLTTEGDGFSSLMRWMVAIRQAAEQARARLDRYRRFEARISSFIEASDKRRQTALRTVLLLLAAHWTLWPKKVADVSRLPHTTAWRAMMELEKAGFLHRLKGRAFAGGANVYTLAIVAEAGGLRAAATYDDPPLPTLVDGELRLESAGALDAAIKDVDRLICDVTEQPSFFSLDDVEL